MFFKVKDFRIGHTRRDFPSFFTTERIPPTIPFGIVSKPLELATERDGCDAATESDGRDAAMDSDEREAPSATERAGRDAATESNGRDAATENDGCDVAESRHHRRS